MSEEWIQLGSPFDLYEVSNFGRVRISENKRPLKPKLRRNTSYIYDVIKSVDNNKTKICINDIFNKYFPDENLEFNSDWFNFILELNHTDLSNNCYPRKYKTKIKTRRCHDCGRPTTDYRCEKCWEKFKNQSIYEEMDTTIFSGRLEIPEMVNV